MPNKKKKKEIDDLFVKQYDRELAEYYAIIDERYGAAWYDLPYSERQQLKIEIRKEAKKRCQ